MIVAAFCRLLLVIYNYGYMFFIFTSVSAAVFVLSTLLLGHLRKNMNAKANLKFFSFNIKQ